MTEPLAPVLITTTAEPVPSRTQSGTFSSDMDTLLGKFPAIFSQMNASTTNVSVNATAASEKAVIASAQAGIATSSATTAAAVANFKGPWSGLTGALNWPASAFHEDRNWQLLQNLADVTSVEPGTNAAVWFDLTFELVKDVSPQLGGDLDGQWNDVDHVILNQIAETVYPVGTLTGGSYAINLSNGLVQSLTISTAEQTFTFISPSATGTNTSFVLYVTNGGSQVVNWPTTVKWPDGEAPDLTAAGLDVIVFSTKDSGSNYYGFVSGQDVK